MESGSVFICDDQSHVRESLGKILAGRGHRSGPGAGGRLAGGDPGGDRGRRPGGGALDAGDRAGGRGRLGLLPRTGRRDVLCPSVGRIGNGGADHAQRDVPAAGPDLDLHRLPSPSGLGVLATGHALDEALAFDRVAVRRGSYEKTRRAVQAPQRDIELCAEPISRAVREAVWRVLRAHCAHPSKVSRGRQCSLPENAGRRRSSHCSPRPRRGCRFGRGPL